MIQSIAAIGVGAVAGALIRWGLGLLLNAAHPLIPLGTLAANLAGAYGIGLALGVFSAFPDIAPVWRLLVITGFFGALTTFSTFSAEVVLLLQEQRMLAASLVVALHVGGSLVMTLFGMGTCLAVRQALH